MNVINQCKGVVKSIRIGAGLLHKFIPDDFVCGDLNYNVQFITITAIVRRNKRKNVKELRSDAGSMLFFQ